MLSKELTNELWSAVRIAKEECNDEYALCYLKALKVSGCYYGEEGIKTQLLYVLNNMQYWRGATASRCKSVFRQVIKELQ